MKRKRIASSNIKTVTIDTIANYLACGVTLLPSLYDEFIDRMMEEDQRSLVCILPNVRLQHYSSTVSKKIKSILKQA